jgi:ribosome-associated protein
MDIRKLQRAIVDGLEDVKAQDIAVFNTEHLSPLFERVIIASGTSNRQTKALAASVRDAVRGHGFPVMRTEGEENGEWIIVDCGAAVAHIMQPEIRRYYHLEEIWGGKVVKMKLGAPSTGLVKASDGEAATPVSARLGRAAKAATAGAAGAGTRKAGSKTATASGRGTAAAKTATKARGETSGAAAAPAKRARSAGASSASRSAGAKATGSRAAAGSRSATDARFAAAGAKSATGVKSSAGVKSTAGAKSAAKAAPRSAAAKAPAARKAPARGATGAPAKKATRRT